MFHYVVPILLGFLLVSLTMHLIKITVSHKGKKNFGLVRFLCAMTISFFGPGCIYVLKIYEKLFEINSDVSGLVFCVSGLISAPIVGWFVKPFKEAK